MDLASKKEKSGFGRFFYFLFLRVKPRPWQALGKRGRNMKRAGFRRLFETHENGNH